MSRVASYLSPPTARCNGEPFSERMQNHARQFISCWRGCPVFTFYDTTPLSISICLFSRLTEVAREMAGASSQRQSLSARERNGVWLLACLCLRTIIKRDFPCWFAVPLDWRMSSFHFIVTIVLSFWCAPVARLGVSCAIAFCFMME